MIIYERVDRACGADPYSAKLPDVVLSPHSTQYFMLSNIKLKLAKILTAYFLLLTSNRQSAKSARALGLHRRCTSALSSGPLQDGRRTGDG